MVSSETLAQNSSPIYLRYKGHQILTLRLYYLSQTVPMNLVLFPGFADALHQVSFIPYFFYDHLLEEFLDPLDQAALKFPILEEASIICCDSAYRFQLFCS